MEKREGLIVLAFVAIVIGAVAFYYTFSYKDCVNYECFQKRMASCSFGSYINEEPEASWLYHIEGRKKGMCDIKVTLLQAKEGGLSLREIEGLSMTCSYELGVSNYPEKDLPRCHGILKEELQEIIIKKLHEYVVGNIGRINEELR